MTLCVLDSDKLSLVPVSSGTSSATVTMTPMGRVYLTTVLATVADVKFCLYAETHAEPRIPDEVADAVAQFNTDPTVWGRLVQEALDAQDEILDEDREQLNARAAQSQVTRRRLLGT